MNKQPVWSGTPHMDSDLDCIRENVSMAAASVYRCKEYEGHTFAYMARQRGKNPAWVRSLYMKAARALRIRDKAKENME